MPAGNVGFTPFAPLPAVLDLRPTPTKTAAYTAVDGDFVICNASGGAFTVNLPPAAGRAPDGHTRRVAVKKQDTSGTAVTVGLVRSADTIYGLVSGGQSSLSVRGEGDVYWLVADGVASWHVVGNFISPSYCDVYNSAQQTGVVTGTHTSVTFGGTNSDPDACFSSPTWTCKKAGVYDFSTTVQWGSLGAGAIGDIGTFVWKNGTGTGTLLTQFYTAQATSSNANPAQICADKTVLVNGDTITIGVFQDSGSNKNLSPTSGHCVFQINRIGG